MHSILYVGTSLAPLLALGTPRRVGESEVQLTRPGDDEPVGFIVECDPARALRWLTARPIDVVVVDARAATGERMLPVSHEEMEVPGTGARERRKVARPRADDAAAAVAAAAR